MTMNETETNTTETTTAPTIEELREQLSTLDEQGREAWTISSLIGMKMGLDEETILRAFFDGKLRVDKERAEKMERLVKTASAARNAQEEAAYEALYNHASDLAGNVPDGEGTFALDAKLWAYGTKALVYMIECLYARIGVLEENNRKLWQLMGVGPDEEGK